MLFTSGTTGAPKMVAHSLAGLTGAIAARQRAQNIVWGTFYDIRRYGGLQILLRALLGRRLADPVGCRTKAWPISWRAWARHGVTHLTGTPSHWRRALMSPAIASIAPRYVRLSGEIADQAVLDSLKARFPDAAIGHAYASTEAGVGFEVTDGLEGFPGIFHRQAGPGRDEVVDGTLQYPFAAHRQRLCRRRRSPETGWLGGYRRYGRTARRPLLISPGGAAASSMSAA